MHIQIIDGEITYYSSGMPVSSHIETNEEIDELISQLEAYVLEKRSPEQVVIEQAEQMAREATDQIEVVSQEAKVTMRMLEDTTTLLNSIMDSFPKWESGETYGPGDILNYDGSLYRVLQAHTSQSDWTPDVSPSLFVDVTVRQIGEETGEIQEWEQPGSTNPYNTGDRVIFEGVIYESTIDGNVWSPTDHPEGWRVIDNETEG